VRENILSTSEPESVSRTATMVPFETFCDRTTQEMARCDRYDRPFTLVMARPPSWAPDLDGLPSQWLRSAALGLTRSYDLIARSDDEPVFLILLPETGVPEASMFLERLRSQIDDEPEWRFAVLAYPEDGRDLRAVLRPAA